MLRRPRDSRDKLPRSVLRGTFAGDAGADPARARFALVENGAALFVAPARDGYCLVDLGEVVSGCWEEETVTRGDAVTVALCGVRLPPRVIQLGGIVPDGVASVTVMRPRFGPQTVRVSGNAFVALLPAGDPLPRALLYRHADGRVTRHRAGIPLRVRQPDCPKPRSR